MIQHATPSPVRCAIYTRKSTSEGLEAEFNTLDAQREAAEAYILSQKDEGWVCLPDRYDDGGFSGGNMERPAVKRLMADVEAGRVDCILVYKVDRLSRSLMDFARIVEVLERQGVSFVSVTQQFNTTHSMGRLTLNILLSFAQFEREIIAERTSDKMSAARRKGRWVGGMPTLGYDVDPAGGRLVVNDEEAVRVRDIYNLYLQHGSLIPTVQDLNARGWTTKRHISKRGRAHGGKAFTKTSLHYLLTNHTLAGKVFFDDEVYEGEHEAIIDEDTWAKVQSTLRRNCRSRGTQRNQYSALLRGLLYCDPCNSAMIHTMSSPKNGRQYRYYVCVSAQKKGWDTCSSKSIPAAEVEKFVVDEIRCIGRDAAVVEETVRQATMAGGERIHKLEADRVALERSLKSYNERVRELVGATGDHITTRLAELQDKIRDVHSRMATVEKDIVTARAEQIDEDDLRAALASFDPVWKELTPNERERVIRLLVERVGYDGDKGTVAITFKGTGIKTLARESV